ncbi:CRAL-TRIO domain-containing protein [Caerostris darwini]|uniref:CRAL-TRIO domain-containing protein n=1 Tax=Caerostris darwini TaxID=1538125 RepID=A0AAV4P266_9ARAC|nr:CRAL-TRIO domain-containing protein [Caerostris darwini]
MPNRTGITKFRGKDVLPLDIRFVPDFLRKKLEEDVHEKPENRQKCLSQLKERLLDHKITKDVDFEDDFLLSILRHHEYKIEKAKANVLTYFSLRKNHSYFFTSIKHNFLKIPSSQTITLLPNRHPDGAAVVLFQLGKWYPSEILFEDAKKLCFLVAQQELRNPVTQMTGFYTIDDFSGTGLRHLPVCTLLNMLLLLHVSFDVLPINVLGIHIVNGNFMLATALALAKPFLSESIRKILYVHSSPEELLDYFPASVLPEKYGGTLKEFYVSDWYRKANEEHHNFPPGGQKNLF